MQARAAAKEAVGGRTGTLWCLSGLHTRGACITLPNLVVLVVGEGGPARALWLFRSQRADAPSRKKEGILQKQSKENELQTGAIEK